MENTKFCKDCNTEKDKGYFGKETANKDGLRSICKSCNSKRALQWHNRNRDRVNARERASHQKDPTKNRDKNNRWRRDNPNKVREINKKRWANRNIEKTKEDHLQWRVVNKDKVSANSKKSYSKNKDKIRVTHRKWEQNNKGKRRSIVAKRRAMKIQATPKWLTDEDFCKIELFYLLASDLTKQTGTEYEVDHIIPLQGDTISGLHHWNNLQVLTAEDNRSKGNKIDFTINGLFPKEFELNSQS